MLPISLALLVRSWIWSTLVPMVAATCDMEDWKLIPTPTEALESSASLLVPVLTSPEIRLPAVTDMALRPLLNPLASSRVSPVML